MMIRYMAGVLFVVAFVLTTPTTAAAGLYNQDGYIYEWGDDEERENAETDTHA